jgi:CCR4-NOT transcription complex subunit 6
LPFLSFIEIDADMFTSHILLQAEFQVKPRKEIVKKPPPPDFGGGSSRNR